MKAIEGTTIPDAIKDLRFSDKPTLSEWAKISGVQCGKTAYHTSFIKYVMNEFIRQRPYRHMWE